MLGGKHWVAGLLLLALGAGLYLWQGGQIDESNAASSGGRAPAVARSAQDLPTTGRITHCLDGDSFNMQTTQGEQGVRLFGVDTPEKGQPFGEEARAFAKSHWEGQEVEVVSDHGTDRYGRRALEMRLKGGPVIQRLLLDSGLAWHYRQYAPDRHDFAEAELAARKANRGLWSRKNPIPPWEWRKTHPK